MGRILSLILLVSALLAGVVVPASAQVTCEYPEEVTMPGGTIATYTHTVNEGEPIVYEGRNFVCSSSGQFVLEADYVPAAPAICSYDEVLPGPNGSVTRPIEISEGETLVYQGNTFVCNSDGDFVFQTDFTPVPGAGTTNPVNGNDTKFCVSTDTWVSEWPTPQPGTPQEEMGRLNAGQNLPLIGVVSRADNPSLDAFVVEVGYGSGVAYITQIGKLTLGTCDMPTAAPVANPVEGGATPTCHVINDYQLFELPEVATSGSYLHVEWFFNGEPEKEALLPGGRYTVTNAPDGGHVWEYSSQCSEAEVREQVDEHIERRLGDSANNAGFFPGTPSWLSLVPNSLNR